MTAAFIAIVAVVLFLIGTAVALAWWTLARTIAPYKDELDSSGKKIDDENVVVIDPTAAAPTRPDRNA